MTARHCWLSGALLASLLAGVWSLAGPPAPKTPPLKVVTYDIADLVERTDRRTAPGKPHEPAHGGVTWVVERICRSIDPEVWRPDGPGDRIEVLQGTQLRVRTTAERHAQVEAMLDTLRALVSSDILIESRLYEIDREVYEKTVKPALRKGNDASLLPAVLPEENEVIEAVSNGKLHASAHTRSHDAEKKLLLQAQHRFTHRSNLRPGDRYPDVDQQGVELSAVARLERARAGIQLELFESSRDLVRLERYAYGPEGKQKVLETPHFDERSSSWLLPTVTDGSFVLVPLASRSLLQDKAKGGLVVVLHVSIAIPELPGSFPFDEGPYEIEQVDRAKETVVVRPLDPKGKPEEVSLKADPDAPRTELRFDGHKGAFASLVPGLLLRSTFSPDGVNVLEVYCRELQAVIEEVDAGRGTIGFRQRGTNLSLRRVPVAESLSRALLDLQPGTRVELRLAAGTRQPRVVHLKIHANEARKD